MTATKPFWREKALNQYEAKLLELVLEAHHHSVFRENMSSIALKLSAAGSRSYTGALIGALSTLGELHGPIEKTTKFLALPAPWFAVPRFLADGRKVPGWGNSFVRGQKDPAWLPVDACLAAVFSDLFTKLERVTIALDGCGKKIFPNPSAYTAAAALALGIPAGLAPWLLVRGRVDGWTELLAKEGKWA